MPQQYLKPQVPLKKKDKYYYPLTTADQVILDDGRRLSEIDFERSDLIFLGSTEDFPERGEIGKFYVKNNYIYAWDGSTYRILSVQSVNGRVGQVELTAADVGALAHPSDTAGVSSGAFLVVKNIQNGRVEVGFQSLTEQTGGFIEFTEDSDIPVESRRNNTLYGLRLRAITENSAISYNG